jgi:DNA-binding NtrC family response regulator
MNQPVRILLTDDNTEFCLNLKDILEMKGYEVFIAHDGTEAMEFIKHTSVDLVLMDIRMPSMNGLEIFKIMKMMIPGIPVIMLTGFAVEELIRESLQLGVYGCLHKPLDFDELFLTIENAVADGLRVLVVDENLEFCEEVSGILTRNEWSVSFACDGLDAVGKARRNLFDVLIIDMKVPPVKGLETYLSIRSIRPETEVIIVTGHYDELAVPIREALLKKECVFFQKPLEADALVSLVSKFENHKKEKKIQST